MGGEAESNGWLRPKVAGWGSFLTAPCRVQKEEEEGLCASALSSGARSMVGGGVHALSLGGSSSALEKLSKHWRIKNR